MKTLTLVGSIVLKSLEIIGLALYVLWLYVVLTIMTPFNLGKRR